MKIEDMKAIWDTAHNEGGYAAGYESDGGAGPLLPAMLAQHRKGAGGKWRVDQARPTIAGFVLGYYSSYERFEVPSFDIELYDAAMVWSVYLGCQRPCAGVTTTAAARKFASVVLLGYGS